MNSHKSRLVDGLLPLSGKESVLTGQSCAPCRRSPAKLGMKPSCTASQQSIPDSMDAERDSGDIKAEERDGGAASAATEPQEDHRQADWL